FKTHIDQSLINIITALNISLIHLFRHMKLSRQRFDCRILARDARAYRVIQVDGCNIFHDYTVSDYISDTPAGHGMGLAETVDDNRLFFDFRIHRQTDMFAFQSVLAINFICYDKDIMLFKYFDKCIHLLSRIRSEERRVGEGSDVEGTCSAE